MTDISSLPGTRQKLRTPTGPDRPPSADRESYVGRRTARIARETTTISSPCLNLLK